jgi:hypothetical protein
MFWNQFTHLVWSKQGLCCCYSDQSVCGSCWSFGTTGTIEGAYFLKYGHQVRLSQQVRCRIVELHYFGYWLYGLSIPTYSLSKQIPGNNISPSLLMRLVILISILCVSVKYSHLYIFLSWLGDMCYCKVIVLFMLQLLWAHSIRFTSISPLQQDNLNPCLALDVRAVYLSI